MTVLGEWMISQGGGFVACFEEGILVSQPSPLGEGAPKGRIGQTWYERQLVVQGKERRICAACESTRAPPFLLGDARKWLFGHELPVITTIWVAP